MLFGLVTALSIFGGCSSYSAPTLSLAGIESVEETPQGLVLLVRLRAENENEVALPLRQVDYTARLGDGAGALTFTGRRSPESTLRRKGGQEIVLPVALALRPAGADGTGAEVRPTGVVPFSLTAELMYITPGALADVLFDAEIRRPVANVSASGMVDVGSGPGAPVRLVEPVPTP